MNIVDDSKLLTVCETKHKKMTNKSLQFLFPLTILEKGKSHGLRLYYF